MYPSCTMHCVNGLWLIWHAHQLMCTSPHMWLPPSPPLTPVCVAPCSKGKYAAAEPMHLSQRELWAGPEPPETIGSIRRLSCSRHSVNPSYRASTHCLTTYSLSISPSIYCRHFVCAALIRPPQDCDSQDGKRRKTAPLVPQPSLLNPGMGDMVVSESCMCFCTGQTCRCLPCVCYCHSVTSNLRSLCY